jgi:hypothetical protein
MPQRTIRLLDASEPRYDVASIAATMGRSITHVYQRLRLAELDPGNCRGPSGKPITAGHAVLISRLLQDQQKVVATVPRRLAHEGEARDSGS